jgi:predicted acetyltransferase
MALLRPAEVGDRPALEALLYDYLTELGGVVGGDWDPKAYPWIDQQWTEPGRHPFFIVSGGKPVGLAMARCPLSTSSGLHQVAEFYLAPDHRGQGLAARAAEELFRTFPGSWELTAHEENPQAVAFWNRVASAVAGTPPQTRVLDEDGERRVHFTFQVV